MAKSMTIIVDIITFVTGAFAQAFAYAGSGNILINKKN